VPLQNGPACLGGHVVPLCVRGLLGKLEENGAVLFFEAVEGAVHVIGGGVVVLLHVEPGQQLAIGRIQGGVLNGLLEDPDARLNALALLHEGLQAVSDVADPLRGVGKERRVLLHRLLELPVEPEELRQFRPERVWAVQRRPPLFEHRNGLPKMPEPDQRLVDRPVRVHAVRGLLNRAVPCVVCPLDLFFQVQEAGLFGPEGDGWGRRHPLVDEPEGVVVPLDVLVCLFQLSVERRVLRSLVVQVFEQLDGPLGLSGAEVLVRPLKLPELRLVRFLGVEWGGVKPDHEAREQTEEARIQGVPDRSTWVEPVPHHADVRGEGRGDCGSTPRYEAKSQSSRLHPTARTRRTFPRIGPQTRPVGLPDCFPSSLFRGGRNLRSLSLSKRFHLLNVLGLFSCTSVPTLRPAYGFVLPQRTVSTEAPWPCDSGLDRVDRHSDARGRSSVSGSV